MKHVIKRLFKIFGYQIGRIPYNAKKDFYYGNHVGGMDYMLMHLKSNGLECKSILDVGANKASWSRMAKEIFPKADFYLIEPQVEMESSLKSFTNEYPNSSYFLNGAGALNEILTLTIWDDLVGSSLLPKEDISLLKTGKQRKIQIVKIDDLIENGEIKKPDIVKLDIQGYELEALKGAEKTFGYTEVYIIEVSLFSFSNVPGMPVISDVINFMLDRNYVVYDFAGFLRRPLDGALGQCDICFVKENGFLRESNDWK